MISAVIYPIEAHWIWGGGWLSQMGFHDFAGSCAIHMVGGISALIGAAILGPRIGKFSRGKEGKITKVNAFPGHNLPIGCLGVFILWLGWYGFNGAAAGFHNADNNSGPRHCYGSLHDLYLDQIWQTGCVHVSECFSGRACGDYGAL